MKKNILDNIIRRNAIKYGICGTAAINIFSIGIILVFLIGLSSASVQIVNNRYVPYQMYRLVTFTFQKCLNESFRFLFVSTTAVLFSLFLTRLLRKHSLSSRITVSTIAAKIIKLFLVGLAFGTSLVYLLIKFNRWMPDERFEVTSLLGDALIFLALLLLAWILIKWRSFFIRQLKRVILKLKSITHWLANLKTKKIKKASLSLLALLALFNLIVFIEDKITTPNGPNVIFIAIDALRADHLSCYGYQRKTSPFMDQLAKDGVMFTKNISQSSWTKASVASFITSSYEILNEVVDSRSRLPSSYNTMAEILKNNSYKTGAFIANPWLLPKFGFEQGFDYYNSKKIYARERRIGEKDIINYIERQGNNKFFLYLHFMDVHNSYNPPAPYDKMFVGEHGKYVYKNGLIDISKEDLQYTEGLYDGEIRFLDQKIKNLFEYLEKCDLLDNTLIVFVSDHGDEFLEHGGMGHGTTLHNELLHVPFFIVNNSRINIKNSTIDSYVRNIDVLPTIMDILNIPAITKKEGVSLLPLIEGVNNTAATDSVLSKVTSQSTDHRLISVSKGKFKYIYDNTPPHKKELYDISVDPGEKVNLIEMMPELSKNKDVLQLKNAMKYFVETDSNSSTKETSLDSKTIKQLRSLGYLQ